MVTLLLHGMDPGTGDTYLMEYSLRDITPLELLKVLNFLVNYIHNWKSTNSINSDR
jgi:hypothetical protein